MGWVNKPMEFVDPGYWDYGFTFPAIVLEEHGDGTFTGIIDEDRLTTANRVILDWITG